MADFSYFDQFQDIEIDLTSYLKSIPVSKYSFNNKQPVITTVKNLFTKFDITVDYKNNIDLISKYIIKDNEFIETVSYNIYESTEYWWIITLFNNIRNPFSDWPLSQDQLISIAKKLYEQERKYSFYTYLDFLTEENELKREIIVPNHDTVKDIIWKYRQAILGI